jgi:pyruvate/2-oxoglutarate dehydrogenase complex dihydrolipoamide acyltransferase (E2) component
VVAPADGVVVTVPVSEGDTVDIGAVLVILDTEETDGMRRGHEVRT